MTTIYSKNVDKKSFGVKNNIIYIRIKKIIIYITSICQVLFFIFNFYIYYYTTIIYTCQAFCRKNLQI